MRRHMRRLTSELSGRTPEFSRRRERILYPALAAPANAHHGPLQRLLEAITLPPKRMLTAQKDERSGAHLMRKQRDTLSGCARKSLRSFLQYARMDQTPNPRGSSQTTVRASGKGAKLSSVEVLGTPKDCLRAARDWTVSVVGEGNGGTRVQTTHVKSTMAATTTTDRLVMASNVRVERPHDETDRAPACPCEAMGTPAQHYRVSRSAPTKVRSSMPSSCG